MMMMMFMDVVCDDGTRGCFRQPYARAASASMPLSSSGSCLCRVRDTVPVACGQVTNLFIPKISTKRYNRVLALGSRRVCVFLGFKTHSLVWYFNFYRGPNKLFGRLVLWSHVYTCQQ
jgi:hypothetical protein